MQRVFVQPLKLAVLAAVALTGCGGGSHGSAEAAAIGEAFPVTTPVVQDVTVAREYVADIRAVKHAELRARFKGIIESVAVDEGQAVKAGQTLFTINARARKQDVAVERAATRAAEAELQAAELELDNTKVLTDKNIVSSAELARARTRVEMLRARVEQAKAATARATVELDRAEIRAPFDGVINRVPRKAGSAVSENELLTTITNATQVLAYFSLAEAEYLAFQKQPDASPAAIELELIDGTRLGQPGTIDAIGSEVDPSTGTIAFRARFANPAGVVKHGSSGKVVLATTVRNAVLVPQQATFEIQGDHYVYTVDDNEVVHARRIVIGERLEDAFIVASGLAPTDRFVSEGVQKLRNGTRITVRRPPPAPPRG